METASTPDAPSPSVEMTRHDDIRGQPILVTLSRLRGGRLVDDMQIELAKLVSEVVHNAQGKGGKLVLELSVDKPNPKMHLTGREIVITGALKTKLPDDPPDAAIFFFDDDGGLHDNDPYQKRIQFGQPR